MYVSTTLSYDDDKVKDFSFTANTHRGIATGKKRRILMRLRTGQNLFVIPKQHIFAMFIPGSL